MTDAGPAATEAGSAPGEGGSEPGEGGSGSGPGPAGCGAQHAAPSRLLVPALLFIALVVAAVGSLGAPLITSVATYFGVTLASAQWTLTATLLSGAVATPVLGRLGTGPRRRRAVLGTLAIVVTGGVLTVAPLGFGWLLAGRAAQGTGLGLTALMMATARDHLGAGADASSGSGEPGSGEPGSGEPGSGEPGSLESGPGESGSGEPSAGGRVPRRSRSGQRDRAASAIALISVASTAGIGVGYPVAGLLTELAGLRAAYTLGLVVTAAALAIAALALPPAPAAARTTAAPPETTRPPGPATSRTPPRPARPAAALTRPAMPPGSAARPGSGSGTSSGSAEAGGVPRASLDVPGAILLAAGLVTLLITIGDPGLWQRHLALAGGLLAAAAILLTAWAAYERTVTTPLADVSLLRHPAVARANVAMLAGGAGMYLLLTTLTRYVQTPQSAGYGFGVSTFVAGLALVPFSALGFAAGRLTPRLSARIGPDAVLTVSAVVVLAAFAMFALARASFAEALVAMALVGCGVGGFSAAMPAVILAVTPARETASAMGINQVVRSVGFSVGSAAGGLILAAGTSPGQTFPASGGYTAAAGAGVVIMAVTAVITGAGVRAGRRGCRLARAGLDR